MYDLTFLCYKFVHLYEFAIQRQWCFLFVICGVQSGDLKVKRKGVILLTFAPAIGERKYDWAKKQVSFLAIRSLYFTFMVSSVNT